MKKIICMLVCISMMLVLMAGCGSSSDTAAATTASSAGASTASTSAASSSETASVGNGQVLIYSYSSQPYITLDPRVEYSNGIMPLQNVYETLTHYNSETKELDPMLAESWSSNEDGTEWTFVLRDGVTFHDGCPVTAEDVKVSIEKTIELGQGASYNWDSVDHIETNGDKEVTFYLSYAAPLDLVSSAGYAAYIYDKDCAEQDTEWFNEGNDGGSGPYTISQVTREMVVLSAYPEYYRGWSDNQYTTVVIQEQTESSARRQMLETGEAQISDSFSSTDLAALREETNIVKAVTSESFTNAIAFLNTQKYPCDNADFRKVLEYAFPYEDAVEGVMDGNAFYSIGLVTRGLWGHDDTLPTYTTDLDKAAECLEASGVDPSSITLNLTYSTVYPEYAQIMQIWQSNLKTLGIDLQIRSEEWDAQWSEAKAPNTEDQQDIFVMVWWPDYASPNSWFDSLVHSEDTISYNLAYINNPEMDAKIDEADMLTATDRDAAEKLYIEVQQMLYDEADLVQMYDQCHTYIISNTIQVDGPIENPAYATAIPFYNITSVN